MGRPGRHPLARALLVLAISALAGMLAASAGWLGGAGDPAVTRGGAQASPGAPVSAAPGAPSTEALGEVMRVLLAAMGGEGEELFSGAPDDLPPVLRTFLHDSGADLLLGVGVVDADGALTVAAVIPGSPAERGGLDAGDVITELDGMPVASAAELRAAVERVAPGTTYALTLLRAGAVATVAIMREAAQDGDPWRGELLRSLALGMMLADRPGGPDLPPSLLGEMVEETPDGLRVFAVFPGSPADRAGLRPGDLLLAIDGHEVSTLDEMRRATPSILRASRSIEVTLERGGERVTIRVPVAPGGAFGGRSES